MKGRQKAVGLVVSALWCLDLGTWAVGQGTPSPRPGLTAQQTKQAVEVAREALVESRKKSEAASKPGTDRREYIVGVEMLAVKEPQSAVRPGEPKEKTAKGADQPRARETPEPGSPAKRRGTLALVTSYRYSDDMTVFATVDLGTGRVVNLESAQHLRTPLSDEEYEEAKALAKERSEQVKALYQKFGEKLSLYPQFSQFTVKDDPRIHRVIHLTYRVGTKDLSYPRPFIDLTTRQVATPEPEVFPQPRQPR